MPGNNETISTVPEDEHISSLKMFLERVSMGDWNWS
jgi:hypothetical protein